MYWGRNLLLREQGLPSLWNYNELSIVLRTKLMSRSHSVVKRNECSPVFSSIIMKLQNLLKLSTLYKYIYSSRHKNKVLYILFPFSGHTPLYFASFQGHVYVHVYHFLLAIKLVNPFTSRSEN